ncbi:MAG: hypothetical protein HYX75_22105 [Acidobacteria bacterium]|nr:hypothetical protein [Acidobacteriota bacterium]
MTGRDVAGRLMPPLALLGILFLALLVFVPWWTGPCGTVSDASSDLVLNEAFAGSWDFAHSIVWPFGPLGFLYSRNYHPGTYAASLWLWGYLATTLAVSLYLLARRFAMHPVLILIWSAAVMFVCSIALDTIFFALLTIAIFERFTAPDRIHLGPIALSVAAAILALVKFPLFALSILVYLILACDDLLRRHRVPTTSCVFFVSVLVAWRLSGQDMTNLPAFIFGRLMISFGYTGAMALKGPWAELFVFGALAASLLTLLGRRESELGGRLALLRVSAVGFVLFLAFKEGFVRHDGHALIAISVLLCAGLLAAAVVSSGRIDRGRRRLLLLVHPLLTTGLLWWSLLTYTGSGLPARMSWLAGNLEDRLAAVSRLIREPGRMPREYLEFAALVRQEYPLPHVPGSVDIYPVGQTALIHSGLRYAPRPVFQSYVTYSDRLAELNAAHLRSDRAADFIFFHVWPIDARYPSLDDGLSWPELLSRYHVRSSDLEMLVLERQSPPASVSFHPLGTVQTSFDVPSPISPGMADLVWARVDVRLSLIGHVLEFLFKNPWVYVEVTTEDGAQRRYMIVPALARGGFLLSPLVVNHEQFGNLYTGEGLRSLSGNRVRSLRFSTFGPRGLLYKKEIRISLYELRCGR